MCMEARLVTNVFPRNFGVRIRAAYQYCPGNSAVMNTEVEKTGAVIKNRAYSGSDREKDM